MQNGGRRKRAKITRENAIQICLLWLAGWYQHDIGAKYGQNQGRVSEIVNGKKFPEAMPAARTIFP